MPTAKMVAMLLKELRTIFAVQLAWMYMLVVIFIDVLFGGLGYGTLQPHCARMRMASVPRLNYKLLPSFVYVIICKNKDGKGSSTRNRWSQLQSYEAFRNYLSRLHKLCSRTSL